MNKKNYIEKEDQMFNEKESSNNSSQTSFNDEMIVDSIKNSLQIISLIQTLIQK